MISRSLILQILQAAKIMRRFFYEAPAEIMRNYTTDNNAMHLQKMGIQFVQEFLFQFFKKLLQNLKSQTFFLFSFKIAI